MTIPCDKGPALERIESKIDRMSEVVIQSAVTTNNVAHLQEQLGHIDERVKELEDLPKRTFMAALLSGFATAAAAVVTLLFSGWGR